MNVPAHGAGGELTFMESRRPGGNDMSDTASGTAALHSSEVTGKISWLDLKQPNQLNALYQLTLTRLPDEEDGAGGISVLQQ